MIPPQGDGGEPASTIRTDSGNVRRSSGTPKSSWMVISSVSGDWLAKIATGKDSTCDSTSQRSGGEPSGAAAQNTLTAMSSQCRAVLEPAPAGGESSACVGRG